MRHLPLRAARLFVACATVALLPLVVSRAAPAADPPPTQAELKQELADRKFQPLLQQLTRVLQLKGDAARPYDKAELYLIKGEAHLQLKEISLALDAYGLAEKAATASGDRQHAALARAAELLLKQSKAFAYTPKTGTAPLPPAVDILDLARRKEAYGALFADLSAAAAPKVKVANAAKTLPPVVEAMKALSDVDVVEIAATDKDAQTGQFYAQLAGHARDMMKDALTKMAKQVADISANANTYDEIRTGNNNMASGSGSRTSGARGGGSGTAQSQKLYQKRGLSYNDQTALKSVIATCQQIEPAAKDLAAAAASEPKTFEPILEQATKLQKDAQDALAKDYGGPVTEANKVKN